MSSPVRPKFTPPTLKPGSSSATDGTVAATVADRAILALADAGEQHHRIETLRIERHSQIDHDDLHVVAPAFADWVNRFQAASAPPLANARRDGALVGATLGGAMGLWHATKGGGDAADLWRILLMFLAGGAAVGVLGGSAVQSLASHKPQPVPEAVPDDVLASILVEHFGWKEPADLVDWRVHGLRESWARRARNFNLRHCAHVNAAELLNGAIAIKKVIR